MRIAEITAEDNWMLLIVAQDGRTGRFDVRPYLDDEAFHPLRDVNEFARISNGGYFIEWQCGADLSADTLEAKWQDVSHSPRAVTASVTDCVSPRGQSPRGH